MSVSSILEMDHDDDDGVGFVRESHYLKNTDFDHQQARALLNVPEMRRETSISSNVSDMDVPIYSSECLTTVPRKPTRGVSKTDCKQMHLNVTYYTMSLIENTVFYFPIFILSVSIL